MKNYTGQEDITWLKANELRVWALLHEAEKDDPDSIESYNLRKELSEVRDQIDFVNSL